MTRWYDMMRLRYSHYNESGFSITELVVAASIITVGILSVLVMFSSSFNTSTRSRARSQADNISMDKLESVRTLAYANVTQAYLQTNLGTTATRGGLVYTISYAVVFIDDPTDGTGAADANPNDYKKVTITVAWTNPKPADSVVVETLVNDNPLPLTSATPDTTAPVWPGGNNVLTGRAEQTNPGYGNFITWAGKWATDAVGVTGYLIYRQGPGDTTFLLFAVEAPTIGQYLDGNIVPGSSYSYYIKPYDAAGNIGAASNALTIVAPADTVAPTMPTDLTLVSFNATSATMSWTPSLDNSGIINHYNIYRTHGGVPYGSTPYTTSLLPPFIDYGLTTGTQYSYRFSAVDNAGNESVKTNDLNVTPQ